MIDRITGTKNGYRMSGDTTNEEFQKTISGRRPLKCIVVNEATRRRFSLSLLSNNIFTINNRVKDNEFYINSFR